MKKLVTTLLTFLSVAVLCASVTACSGEKDEENGKDDKTVVTEAQWNAAIDVFTENRTTVNENNSKVKITLEASGTEGGENSGVTTYECDYESKAVYIADTYNEISEGEQYIWYSASDRKFYNAGWALNNDGVKEYFKNDLTDEFGTDGYDELHLVYSTVHYECLNDVFVALCGGKPLKESFKLFTYADGAYSYSRSFSDAHETDDPLNVSMKAYFTDGKLVGLDLVNNYYFGPETDFTDTYKFTFEYGAAEVRVPQAFTQYAITDERWDELFGSFNSLTPMLNDNFLNLKITLSGESTEDNISTVNISEYDYANKIISFTESHVYDDGKESIYISFDWLQDGKTYMYRDWGTQKYKSIHYGATFESVYAENLANDSLIGILWDYECDDNGRLRDFREFGFDPVLGAYTLSEQYKKSEEQDAPLSLSVKLYFDNGMPVRVDCESSYYYHGVQTDKFTVEIEYGTVNLKVPQDVLDMSLT